MKKYITCNHKICGLNEHGRCYEVQAWDCCEYLKVVKKFEQLQKNRSLKIDGQWVAVKDKLPELIKDKDYSEVVEGYNKHNGVFFASCSWVNDGDNSGYTWNMHESGYRIDEDPSEWMDEDDYPTHWRIITKPIAAKELKS